MAPETTESLCPVCLSRIPAVRVPEGEDVFLQKCCPFHGEFRTLIWRGPPAFDAWRRPKIPTRPSVPFRDVREGCPFDCGLCPEHRQRTCTLLIEVTGRCDLRCPVCYADSGQEAGPDPDRDTLMGWFRSAARAADPCNLQISGGEPTLRDDLDQRASHHLL